MQQSLLFRSQPCASLSATPPRSTGGYSPWVCRQLRRRLLAQTGRPARQQLCGCVSLIQQHGFGAPFQTAYSRGRVRLRHAAVKAAKQSDSADAAPAERFSRKDLRRIETQGPSIADLVHTHVIQEEDEEEGKEYEEESWIPAEVLGNQTYAPEPQWRKLRQMPYMEFYQGLRERNWMSEHYRQDAPPWSVQFFEDSGRLMRPAFAGFRALVTMGDGSQQWVALPTPGARTFMQDYVAGGGAGAIHRFKRVGEPLVHPAQYGYNQVFEQIFQAYEQPVMPALEWRARKQGWLEASQLAAPPAERQLQLSFHQTPQEASLKAFWDAIPIIGGFTFALGFIFFTLAIGIFKPRKAMPSDAIQAMEFAQSKGKARREGMTGVRFAEVAGIDYIKSELEDIVSFLNEPGKYGSLMAKPPKGVLLEGDPGNGKTLVAKAIAGEAGVPFYQMSGSEFVESIVGVGAARVRDLFKRARVNAPCIVFVDEVDALGIKRAGAGVRTNEEREQTLNQLLTEMDGFTPDIGVVFIGATNRADLLDPALLRSGRFDRKVRIMRPDAQSRYEILQVHARNKPIEEGVDLKQVANDLPGLSGAELANVLNEAALEAVRRDGSSISADDIYNAVDRILQGVKRPPLPDRLPVKRALAVHESGKGLVATLLHAKTGYLERVERISMVPRGKDWTRTVFLRGSDEEYTLTTRARLLERIRVTLAGRAAEQVLLGHPTTYSTHDLQDAAKLAQKLVMSYGLSGIGLTTYAPPSRPPGYGRKAFEVAIDNIDADLFGMDSSQGSYFQPSDSMKEKIRKEVHGVLHEAYDDLLEMLNAHRDALEATTQQLLANQTVSGQELSDLVAQHPPTPDAARQQPAEPVHA